MNSFGSGFVPIIVYASLNSGSLDNSILTELGTDLLAEDDFFIEYENA